MSAREPEWLRGRIAVISMMMGLRRRFVQPHEGEVIIPQTLSAPAVEALDNYIEKMWSQIKQKLTLCEIELTDVLAAWDDYREERL